MMNCLYAPTIYGFILFIFELWKRIPSNIYIVSPGLASCNAAQFLTPVLLCMAYAQSFGADHMVSFHRRASSRSQSLSWYRPLGTDALGHVRRSFPQIHTEEQSC